MALSQVNAGDKVLAANLNQYYQLLTGAMTDQPVTFGNVVVYMAYVSVSSGPYTVPRWGYHVDVDASAGAVTVNLPTAAGKAGALIEVRKKDSSLNTITVAAASGQYINGASSFVLYSQYDSVSLRSDGSNVMVV